MTNIIDPRILKIEVWKHGSKHWIVYTDATDDTTIYYHTIQQPQAQLLIQGGMSKVIAADSSGPGPYQG